MKVIDLLNKIANGEIEENIEYKFSDYDYCTIKEFFNRYVVDKWNLNLEIIEEDKLKTKVMVVDKEGNGKEYLLELGEGLKEGEKIFKANNGNWYAQKLIDKKSEFYKWLDEFEPTIYYSMEEKKIPEKLEEFGLIQYNLGYIDYKNIETLKEWLNKDFQTIYDTIDLIIKNQNKLIDYLKSKGDE